MQVSYRIIFSLLAIISFSCVERFNPVLDGYENLLVVDGYFTDEEKSHQINLCFASNVYSEQFEPVLGADVKVVSEDGDIIQFIDYNSSGQYFSNEGTKGEVGKKYKLTVMLSNSKYYETNFQDLISCPPIDSVYGERETRQTWETNEDLDGLQFYLDAKKVSSKTVFFQWKLTETFKYEAERLLEAYYAGRIFTVTKKDSLYTCWKTNEITTIYTHSIKYSNSAYIKKFPLLYVGNNTKQLSRRYSLNVKQFAINEGAYKYWNSIREQIDNQGTLYSTQPYQVKGNLNNTDNPDEVVLGYFVVAGVVEKRIFVNKPGDLIVRRDNCTVNTDMMSLLPESPPGMWPIFLAKNSMEELGVVDAVCVDCQLEGGGLNKPDFWE